MSTLCECNIEPAIKTSKIGKEYYTCSGEMGRKCKFFAFVNPENNDKRNLNDRDFRTTADPAPIKRPSTFTFTPGKRINGGFQKLVEPKEEKKEESKRDLKDADDPVRNAVLDMIKRRLHNDSVHEKQMSQIIKS